MAGSGESPRRSSGPSGSGLLAFSRSFRQARIAALPSFVMRTIVRGLRRIFSMVMSPCDSSFVRCTDRLLSDRPVRACRYLKSALTHKSSASSSASRAGSWTMRSMPTMSLNGSDTRGDLVAAGDEEPVLADAHDRQHRGNREVEQGLVRLPGSHTEGAKQREGEQDRGRDQIVAAKR